MAYRIHLRSRLEKALPEIIKNISAVLMRPERAASAAGVPPRTFMRYLSRGKEVYAARMDWEEARDNAEAKGDKPPAKPEENVDEQLLGDLGRAVEEARDKGLAGRLARIAQGKAGWQGSGWLVERSVFREEYAPPNRLEVTGKDGGPVLAIQVRVENANDGRKVLGMPPLEVVEKPGK